MQIFDLKHWLHVQYDPLNLALKITAAATTVSPVALYYPSSSIFNCIDLLPGSNQARRFKETALIMADIFIDGFAYNDPLVTDTAFTITTQWFRSFHCL